MPEAATGRVPHLLGTSMTRVPRKQFKVPPFSRKRVGTLAPEDAPRSRVASFGNARVVDMRDAREDAIRLWTDGSCYPNPGPAGVGVLYEDGPYLLELAEFMPTATNNVAELTAVLRALELVADRNAPVDVYCDSEYVIGTVALMWSASTNRELVAELRRVWLYEVRDARFVKVPGHTGVPGNERADTLAGWARKERKTLIWRND